LVSRREFDDAVQDCAVRLLRRIKQDGIAATPQEQQIRTRVIVRQGVSAFRDTERRRRRVLLLDDLRNADRLDDERIEVVDDLPTPADQIVIDEEVEVLWRWLDALTWRRREILIRQYGLRGREVESLTEIASDLGVTRERVRQVEADALAKIRELAGSAS
jgi:RNA polymerase sigma factor (sigma-70 family)